MCMHFYGFRTQILVEFGAVVLDLNFIADMISVGKCDIGCRLNLSWGWGEEQSFSYLDYFG